MDCLRKCYPRYGPPIREIDSIHVFMAGRFVADPCPAGATTRTRSPGPTLLAGDWDWESSVVSDMVNCISYDD
jgi:hypothetical protein